MIVNKTHSNTYNKINYFIAKQAFDFLLRIIL